MKENRFGGKESKAFGGTVGPWRRRVVALGGDVLNGVVLQETRLHTVVRCCSPVPGVEGRGNTDTVERGS